MPKGPTMALRKQAAVLRPTLALVLSLSLSVPGWAEPTGPVLEVPDLADMPEDYDPPPAPRNAELKKAPEKQAPQPKAEPKGPVIKGAVDKTPEKKAPETKTPAIASQEIQ